MNDHPESKNAQSSSLTRRTLLTGAGGVAAAGAAAAATSAFAAEPSLLGKSLVPAMRVDNPLEYYPDRTWEKVYLDQYAYDRSFTFICSPNDTHGCRVRAFVRNEVVTRVEQDYEHQQCPLNLVS